MLESCMFSVLRYGQKEEWNSGVLVFQGHVKYFEITLLSYTLLCIVVFN